MGVTCLGLVIGLLYHQGRNMDVGGKMDLQTAN